MSNKTDPNAWMVTFSDLITLLLTFFVMLMCMSSLDDKDFRESFGLLTEAADVVEGGGGMLFEPLSAAMQIPHDLTTGQGVSRLDTTDKIARAVKRFSEASEDYKPRVVQSDDSITFRLPEAELFAEQSATLTPQAIDYLTSLAVMLSDVPYPMFPIRVEGFSDAEPPPAGKFRNELELSASRAYSVLMALLSAKIPGRDGGLNPEQYSVIGHGVSSLETDKAQDPSDYRRVDIVFDLSYYNKHARQGATTALKAR